MSNVQRVLIEVDAQGQPSAFPDPVDVRTPNVLLVFRLRGTEWAFPESGAIVVHQGGSAFPCPSWTLGPQTAALLDLDPSPAVYEYTVTVVHTQTQQRLSFDPTIRNGQ